jgi:hypothetical protein
VEPALGVEHVGETEQVALIGAAAVVEDEHAPRVIVRRALEEPERLAQPCGPPEPAAEAAVLFR